MKSTKELIESYTHKDDWRVKENSTVNYSVGGLILSLSSAVTADYWLSEIYDEEIANAHRNCDIHIHDLGMLAGYCAGWSLKQLIQEGLGGVPGKITSSPANHLSTLCNQMVNFLGIMQNEWAGAQAFSSFDTYLAPFVRVDNLSYKEVKQAIQSFVYGVNTPSRWGTQAPFTNVTLDWVCPPDLKYLPAIVGGKELDFTYGECQKEMDMVNKAFIEIMIEGDANGRGFQYPIPTYSITKNFDWSETENNKLLFEMTAKYGTPYFSNYINSDMEPSDVRSMCPMRGDQRVLVMDDHTKEWHISTLKYLFNGNKRDNVYHVLLNGETHLARLNKFDSLKFARIRTVNGHEVVLSENHLNLTFHDGDKQTKDLTTNDYLPFSICKTDGDGLSFEDGYMVGAYMGDGSLNGDNAVVYSVNDTSKSECKAHLINNGVKLYGGKINENSAGNGNCVNVKIISGMLRGLIDEYVSGTALTKALSTKAINRSIAFREGIIAGLLATDGSVSANRIYTASTNAVETICAIAASLGVPTNVAVDKRGKSETLSDNPVYCIRLYKPDGGHMVYGNYYIKSSDYMWFRIASIEHLDEITTGYCFEVIDGDEPYFMLPSGLVTHNCRLRLDLRELRKKSGGFFGSGESTGSVGVVTINLPRLSYLSKDENEFWKRLDTLMDLSARSLKIKRNTITKLLDDGLYPYTKRYLGTFNNHFSTIGVSGGNEMCLNANWLRKDLSNQESVDFMVKVLNHMRERLSDYQELYGDLYNLEATPAESTAYRFAKHDKEAYPDIITANMNGTPYYTNSSHLPVGFSEDVFSALDIQDELQTLYTSGTVFHAFLGERLPTWQAAAALVRKIAENYKLPYYTMSPTYSVCQDHGYLSGEKDTCPVCGKKTEVYSRITGYYRPVQNWNDGKLQEFRDRKTYDIGHSSLHNRKDAVPEETHESNTDVPADESMIMLFATETCPNCKFAAAMLDKAGIVFKKIIATEHIDLANKYGIRQAPTLVVHGDKCDGDVCIYRGVAEIKEWLNQMKG